MKLRLVLAVACFTLGAAALSAVAQATTFELSANYSDTANPNAAGWSYVYSGTPLAQRSEPLQSSPNALFPAIPGGYFSAGGNDLNADNPFVFQAAVSGSAAGLHDTDFLQGDVVVHSPNSGSALSIVWKAPSAGTITDLLTSVWYAHSSVARANDVSLLVAGVLQDSWTVSSTEHNARGAAAAQYDSAGASFAVNAGDLVTLSFTKTSGLYGSLNGVAARIEFTAAAVTPIPATLPLFMSALGGLGWFAHRRRKEAA